MHEGAKLDMFGMLTSSTCKAECFASSKDLIDLTGSQQCTAGSSLSGDQMLVPASLPVTGRRDPGL